MKDLKEKTIRGGLARLAAQAANFALRLGSLTVIARLLGLKNSDWSAWLRRSSVFWICSRDFGLSAATIRHKTVTDEQISTLFWVNLLVGTLLGIFAVAVAPAVAAFYHQPRLVAITRVKRSWSGEVRVAGEETANSRKPSAPRTPASPERRGTSSGSPQ